MDEIQKTLLREIADLHEVPEGAYNIRSNGESVSRRTTEHIDIVTKTDKSGIDIYMKPGTKHESVHIPVILSQTGLKELVYNDFHIGEDCDVTIIGIFNSLANMFNSFNISLVSLSLLSALLLSNCIS